LIPQLILQGKQQSCTRRKNSQSCGHNIKLLHTKNQNINYVLLF